MNHDPLSIHRMPSYAFVHGDMRGVPSNTQDENVGPFLAGCKNSPTVLMVSARPPLSPSPASHFFLEFVRDGWRFNVLHGLLVLSTSAAGSITVPLAVHTVPLASPTKRRVLIHVYQVYVYYVLFSSKTPQTPSVLLLYKCIGTVVVSDFFVHTSTGCIASMRGMPMAMSRNDHYPASFC